jgi:hypothetical protein
MGWRSWGESGGSELFVNERCEDVGHEFEGRYWAY